MNDDDARIPIDLVVHKAVLRADEQGFEGGGRNRGGDVARLEGAEPAVEFHVDQPFLVLLRYPGTGATYFVARVAEP